MTCKHGPHNFYVLLLKTYIRKSPEFTLMLLHCRVFSYLDIVSLCRCACVSKYWHQIALDGSNWQRVDLFRYQTCVKVKKLRVLTLFCIELCMNILYYCDHRQGCNQKFMLGRVFFSVSSVSFLPFFLLSFPSFVPPFIFAFLSLIAKRPPQIQLRIESQKQLLPSNWILGTVFVYVMIIVCCDGLVSKTYPRVLCLWLMSFFWLNNKLKNQ